MNVDISAVIVGTNSWSQTCITGIWWTRFGSDKQSQSHGKFIGKDKLHWITPSPFPLLSHSTIYIQFWWSERPKRFMLAETQFKKLKNAKRWWKSSQKETWVCWFCFAAQLISIRAAHLSLGRDLDRKTTGISEEAREWRDRWWWRRRN